jgi:hypothetical protein
MRNLFLSTVIVLFVPSITFGQPTPIPAKTPNTTTSSSIKSNTYSISFDRDDNDDNSSVSIKRNNNIYKFSARFHENKTGRIKKMLLSELGNTNLTVSSDTFSWVENEKGQKLYECKLTETRLKIFVDKEYANSSVIEMMDKLGLALKDLISGKDTKKEEKEQAESAFKDAESALESAKQELERVKIKNENQTNY